jgi:hypothetical protein
VLIKCLITVNRKDALVVYFQKIKQKMSADIGKGKADFMQIKSSTKARI